MGVHFGARLMLGNEMFGGGSATVIYPAQRAPGLDAVAQAYLLIAVFLVALLLLIAASRRRLEAASASVAMASNDAAGPAVWAIVFLRKHELGSTLNPAFLTATGLVAGWEAGDEHQASLVHQFRSIWNGSTNGPEDVHKRRLTSDWPAEASQQAVSESRLPQHTYIQLKNEFRV